MAQRGVARTGPMWLMTYLVEVCSNSGVRERGNDNGVEFGQPAQPEAVCL